MDHEMDDFERRLRERVDRHKVEREQASHELFGAEPEGLEPLPDLNDLPFEEALNAYDDWIDRRIAAWRGEALLPAQPPPPPPAVAPPQEGPGRRGRVLPIHRLEDMDALMVDSFALREFMPDCATELVPWVECQTLEEFAAPLGEQLPGYCSLFPRWIAEVRRNPGQVEAHNPLSRLALHFPGQSTCINAEQVKGKNARQDLAAALRNEDTLRRTVDAAAAERWGHGFIARHTAWGKGLSASGLDVPYLIQRLELPLPSHPDPRWWQAAAIAEGAMFTTAGWSLWVGQYLAQRATLQMGVDMPRKGKRLRLTQLWDVFKQLFVIVPLETWGKILSIPLPGIDNLVQAAARMLRWLLMNTDLDASLTNGYIRAMQRLVVTVESGPNRFLSPRRLFAQIVMSNAEAQLGIMPLPYAVLMAANLEFDPRWEAAEIHRWLDGDARQNVDARLLMLTRLGAAVKHNVSSLVSAAVHSLGLRPPEGLGWT